MPESPIIHALAKKRAALTGEIAHHQKLVRQKLIDLENLDATILQFDPTYALEEYRHP